MLRRHFGIALILGIGVFAAQGQQIENVANCSTMNTSLGPYLYGSQDTAQHIYGNHYFNNLTSGACTYTGSAQVGIYTLCSPRSTANSTPTDGDASYSSLGAATFPHYHTPSINQKGGAANGVAGGTATSDTEGAVAVNSCLIASCGQMTVTLQGSGNGSGFTVSYGGSPIWSDKNYWSNACTAYELAPLAGQVCTPPGPPPYNNGPNGAYWQWDTSTCSWILPNGASPIVIDTKGTGFKFTDPDRPNGYVSFDLTGDGTMMRISWPKHGSGNAWLALDVDGDGVIKNGKELFGNYTAHADADVPNYPNPNGFNALAWYDKVAMGGDTNLIIDKRDAVWKTLRLWIDEHCYKYPDSPCQSDPSELHTLESMGVTSISLVWSATLKTDAVGNQFKYYAVLNPEAETTPKDAQGNSCCELHKKSKDGRLAYDVFLKVKQN